MSRELSTRLHGLVGRAADREVFVGFAPARLLYTLSFADVLDENAGTGYQRRFSSEHSLDFRRYIQRAGSTTIPLTFNLRPQHDDGGWRLVRSAARARLEIAPSAGRVFAQVDCQHRMGHVADLDFELPFMTFLGLDVRAELEIFNVINGTARGLNGSLLDYHDARLTQNLGRKRPEFLVALHLNDAPDSPWYKQLDLEGNPTTGIPTTGMKRRASLRTMQTAVRRFLSASGVLGAGTTPEEVVAHLVLEYWVAVREVLRAPWADPRRHFLTNGVGVYALMGMLADACRECVAAGRPPADLGRRDLVTFLGEFALDVDWSNTGPLQGLVGEDGVSTALEHLRAARAASPGVWRPALAPTTTRPESAVCAAAPAGTRRRRAGAPASTRSTGRISTSSASRFVVRDRASAPSAANG